MARRKGKRRKGGNGSRSRQVLYILWNFPYLWIVKIGITSRNVKKRLSEIDASAAGLDFVLLSISLPFAYQIEQLIHNLCAPLRVKFSGSGKTERFIFLSLLIAIPLILLAKCIEWAFYTAIAVLILIIILNADKL